MELEATTANATTNQAEAGEERNDDDEDNDNREARVPGNAAR